MTPALFVVLVAFVASLAAVWPRVRGLWRRRPAEPAFSGTLFVAFSLWTIYGALADRAGLVAIGAIGLIVTAMALSVRALLGNALSTRVSRAA